jgi:hypothetical protein
LSVSFRPQSRCILNFRDMNCSMQVEELKALDDTQGKVIITQLFPSDYWLIMNNVKFTRGILNYRHQAQNTGNCGTKLGWIWGSYCIHLLCMIRKFEYTSIPPPPAHTLLTSTPYSLCGSQAHHSRGYSQHSATTRLTTSQWRYFV